jgi:PilZ domain-containing protein
MHKTATILKEATMTSEHRANPRTNKLSFISFVNTEDNEQKSPISLGRTLNISTTGLGIEVFQRIAVGSTMNIEISLDGEIIPVKGKVVRSTPLESGGYNLGIEFDKVQEILATVVIEKH